MNLAKKMGMELVEEYVWISPCSQCGRAINHTRQEEYEITENEELLCSDCCKKTNKLRYPLKG